MKTARFTWVRMLELVLMLVIVSLVPACLAAPNAQPSEPSPPPPLPAPTTPTPIPPPSGAVQPPIVEEPPSPPVLQLPAKGAVLSTVTPRLQWKGSSGAISYRLEISTTLDFEKVVVERSGIKEPYYDVTTGLTWATLYYWRVNATGTAGTSNWSEPMVFATAAEPPELPIATSTSTSDVLSKIAFVSFRDGNEEIYTISADGSSPTRLTNNPAADMYPAYSPDGSLIAFSSNREGTSDIYVMNAEDGSEVVRITDDPGRDWGPAWSPDGDEIAFTSDRNGNREIYIINVEDLSSPGAPTNLTNNPAADYDPVWSPMGDKIAFVSERDGNADIYVMKIEDLSDVQRLTDHPAGDLFPAWSPDGDKIAFTTYRDGIAGLGTEVYVMSADGSGQTNITNNTAMDAEPTWSPDGEKMAFASWRDGTLQIWVMNDDGSEPTMLTDETTGGLNVLNPHWGSLPSVDLPTVVEETGIVGRRPDIILDGFGRPFISFETWADDVTEIGFAVKSDDVWNTSYINDTEAEIPGHGYFPELVLTDSGVKVIYTINSETFRLRFSEWTGSSWTVPSFIAPATSRGGKATVDAHGAIHVAYHGPGTGCQYIKRETDTSWSSSTDVLPVGSLQAHSIAVADGSPRIFYHDTSPFPDVEYAELDSSGTWSMTCIDVLPAAILDVSSNVVALAISPDGTPHVVYFVWDPATGGRTVYKSLSSGIWTSPEVVDTNTTVSLALAVASDGTPRVCYIRCPDLTGDSGHGQLWYAWRGSDGTWHKYLIRDPIGYMHNRLEMVLDADDKPHIICCDYYTWTLWYATVPEE